MKHRLTALFLVLLFVVPTPGCFRYRTKIPGVIRRLPPTEYKVVGSFEMHVRRKWMWGGLVQVNEDDADIEALIRQAVEELGGDGAINVTIKTKVEPKDVLWSIVLAPTIGQSRSIRVEGEAIKFHRPY